MIRLCPALQSARQLLLRALSTECTDSLSISARVGPPDDQGHTIAAASAAGPPPHAPPSAPRAPPAPPPPPELQRLLRVAVVGYPNAGKSELTNRLVGTKVTGVSAKPNTTVSPQLGAFTAGPTQVGLNPGGTSHACCMM